jgi:flagellar hook-basal body complex protein FliE
MIERSRPAGMNLILDQIRQYESRARGAAMAVPEALQVPVSGQPAAVPKPGFGDLVKDAVAAVDAMQKRSQGLAEAYERGEQVPLTEVMLSMQKSSIAFEATLQIRNRVMKAYEDIRSMPI